jgi:hypothetical protein
MDRRDSYDSYNYYFAYGSNTNSDYLYSLEGCVKTNMTAIKGEAYIKGYDLEFHKYATLVSSPNRKNRVYGVLYKLGKGDRCMDKLNKIEDVPKMYKLGLVPVTCKILKNGKQEKKEVVAYTYYMPEKTVYSRHMFNKPPSVRYMTRILAGYLEHNVPVDQVLEAYLRHNVPVDQLFKSASC